MFKHPVLLMLAAMFCGAPAMVVAFVMLPWSIAIGIASMAEQPGLAAINLLLVAAAAYALGSYWILAARTIKGQPFKLGWSFWIACVSALICIAAVVESLPPAAALFVAGPIVVATALCLFRQRTIALRNEA